MTNWLLTILILTTGAVLSLLRPVKMQEGFRRLPTTVIDLGLDRPGARPLQGTVWTLLGAALRLFRIDEQSLWLDELFSYSVARRSIGEVFSGTVQGDTNPPLFNLLLHFALRIDDSELMIRLVPALFSIATIPLFIVLTRRLFDSAKARNIALALLVTSPFHIAYSQEARMYAQLAFFQLAAATFFILALENNRRRDWLAFGLVELLAFYSHSLAPLGLLALDLVALWRWPETRRHWRGLLAAHVLVLVLFLPWLVALLSQANRVARGFWTPPSSWLHLIRAAYELNLNGSLPAAMVPFALSVFLWLFLMGSYVAIRHLVAGSPDAGTRKALQLGLGLAVVPPVVLWLLSAFQPLFVVRALISSSFGLFLIWAWFWAERSRWPDRLAISLGAAFVILALGNYYLHPELQKAPMRQAAQALAGRLLPGDVVLHTSDWSALAFNYYLPDIPQHFLAGDPDYTAATTRGQSGLVSGLVPVEWQQVTRGKQRIWLVVALEHSHSYQQERVAEFEALFHRAQILDVGRTYLMLFRPV